jgi:hypothetical protein
MKLNTKKIERERKRLGLSVMDMSVRLKMTRQAYYDLIKSASTKLSTVTALARELDCEGKDLLID